MALTRDTRLSQATASADTDRARERLLAGLGASIVIRGYRATTVADIVRHARTSKRTFYDHFPTKDDCFIAVLRADMRVMITAIRGVVDPLATPDIQIRVAAGAYATHISTYRAIAHSRIRETPGLGDMARQLHRDNVKQLTDMLIDISSSPGFRSSGLTPVTPQVAMILVGGLQELTASLLEDGHDLHNLADVAATAAMALMGTRS